MIPDDQNQIYGNGGSNGGGGGGGGGESGSIRSSSKKLKQTKVPQRGLGVAQLEQLRRQDSNFSPPPPPPPPPPPTMPSNFPLLDPLFRAHSMSNIENFTVSSFYPMNPSANGTGGFNVKNSSFLRNSSLTYQHQQSSPSWVNVLPSNSMNSSSSSSLKFPIIEPPSSQNGSRNNLPSWPDDQKIMFGLKRPCPFPIDDPPIPSFHTTVSPVTSALIGKEESRSRVNGVTISRDFKSSCPSVTHEPTTSSRRSRKSQTGNSNEEFLNLLSDSIPTHPSMIVASNNKDHFNFKTLPYQECFDDEHIESRHHEGSSQHPICIKLFPPTNMESTSQSPPNNHNPYNNCDDVGGNIDLNLKF